MDSDLTPMADLASRWGVTPNTVSRRLAFLGIKPERQGNLRFISDGHLRMGDALNAHLNCPNATLASYGGLRIGLQADTAVRLSELVEALPLSRSSVFEVVKALGVKTSKLPGDRGQGGGRVAWLSSSDAERVSTAAHAVNRGEVRIADLRRLSIDPPEGNCVLGINLASTSLPEAIAVMIEAWLAAQDVSASL